MQVELAAVNPQDFLVDLGAGKEGRIYLGPSDQGQHSWGFSRQWPALGVQTLPLPFLIAPEAISFTSLNLSLVICKKGTCVRLNMLLFSIVWERGRCT